MIKKAESINYIAITPENKMGLRDFSIEGLKERQKEYFPEMSYSIMKAHTITHYEIL